MANKTTNYKLTKPLESEFYDVGVQNENMDKIDTQMKANADAIKKHSENKQNPHGVTKSQVGLGNVPNVATNDQTLTYTEASTLTKLTSGEKLSVAMGKIAKAIADLISHIADTTKHITAAERTEWNGKAPRSHNHDDRYYTESEMNTKLSGKSKAAPHNC